MVTPVVTSPCTLISTWFLQMAQPKSWFGHLKGVQVPNFVCYVPMSMLPKKTCNDADPEEVHCDAKRYSQLQLVTNQQLLASYQRLHVRHDTCNKKEFALWQQATGLSYSKFVIMLNQNLLSKNLVQPVSQFCHDWMHGILQGTAPIVLHHTLQAIAAEGFEVYQYLEKYFQVWQYPQHQNCQYIYVHVLFQAKRKLRNPRKP